MQTFAHKGEFTLQFQRGTRKTKPHPQAQTKEKREEIKPHPQPLSKERGVKCLGNRKQIEYNWRTYHSSLLGEGLGVRLYFLSPFFCLGLGVRLLFCLLSSSFLTLFSTTKQKWKLLFSVCARPFYGFDDSVFIFLLCNSIHYALHFDASYGAIWVKLHRYLHQIAW